MSLDFLNIDFAKFSSIKIGPKVKVKIINEIVVFDEYIIGKACNLLLSPTPPPLAILGNNFDYINLKNNMLVVGAKTYSSKLFSFCKKHNIKGFEFLANLPGSLGGLVKMNAGMKQYEIFDNLIYIKTATNIYEKNDLDFGYRYLNLNETIFEIGFNVTYGFDKNLLSYFKQLRKNQPSLPSAGSCFKNPPNDSAGRLLELAGFKGKKYNNIGFSDIHSNFLVNYGNGNFYDALYLINQAKDTISKQFNIKLENEIIII